MSAFDENPFAEPSVDNPFADPSVQQVTRNTSNVQRGLDDYNPFDNQQQANPPQQGQGQGVANASQNAYSQPTQPAVMQATQEPPPPYTRTGQQQVNTAELQRRQEELERKAQDLARREEQLRNASSNVQKNNWPPLPEKFCVQPCFYQDINLEIPVEFQRIVRLLYYLWMYHACILLLNFIGGIALLIAAGSAETFGLSLMYLILFTPFSYVCWFRPAYKAFRSDSSFNFMVFFFVFFFQLVVSVIYAIGIPGTGSCGWIGVSTAFSNNVGVGILILVVALGQTSEVALFAVALLWIHRIYRSTGASFAKAQQEFATGVLRNEHVQSAAADVTASAVRAQMANVSSRY